MMSRSKKQTVTKPLASLIQTVPAPHIPVPTSSSLLVSTQQPDPTAPLDTLTIEQELQALRAGTHPGFLRALDNLDQATQEQVLQVHRLKEERLRNADEMFVAEMQAVEDDYKEAAEELREKMLEELATKYHEQNGQKQNDMVTRGKRAKNAGKDERPKKKANIKGIKYTLTNDEISSDLEAVRSQMLGLTGNTRSKSKM